jgi:hypothetical protein
MLTPVSNQLNYRMIDLDLYQYLCSRSLSVAQMTL